MYSSEDIKQHSIRYKGETYSWGESIQTFCHQSKRSLQFIREMLQRYKAQGVEVFWRPSPQETEKANGTVSQQKERAVPKEHILVDLRISNDLHL